MTFCPRGQGTIPPKSKRRRVTPRESFREKQEISVHHKSGQHIESDIGAPNSATP
jgi:hypothetical protein